MDFSLPERTVEAQQRFGAFLDEHVRPHLSAWTDNGALPRPFFEQMGAGGWLGFDFEGKGLVERPALEQAVLMEQLARLSPGVAVTVLVQVSLGLKALLLFGSESLKQMHRDRAIRGETLLCLGNTESDAGSDVARIRTRARKVEEGWLLNGSKAYVTNGSLADFAAVTAISDPAATPNEGLSMFLVDLSSGGVSRTKLDKRVWIPSDLTRIDLDNVLVPEGCVIGELGRGLQQVLEIFTGSRVLIAALTLGTAAGAFEMGLGRAVARRAFGKRLVDFEAKAFEVAEYYARIEAARLAVWKACATLAAGRDFRLEASVAKYLTVNVAQEVSRWAADLFGAASVIFSHPIHKYPMDAWAASLGEGTQDVQKLVIFREVMRSHGFPLS
jgi:alkylation response protein AidB-like acyl-CoA dehydrogenase